MYSTCLQSWGRSGRWTVFRSLTLLLGFLLYSTQSSADAIAGTQASVNETKAAFDSVGQLTSTDLASPARPAVPAAPGVPAQPAVPATQVDDGLGTSEYLVPQTQNFWEFFIKHKTNVRPAAGGQPRHWIPAAQRRAGAQGLQVCIRGRHIDGPHPPAPPAGITDVDPNALPVACGKGKTLKWGVGGTASRSVYKRQEHAIQGGGKHYDHYGLVTSNTALQVAAGTGQYHYRYLRGSRNSYA